jgi:hypothetical protein
MARTGGRLNESVAPGEVSSFYRIVRLMIVASFVLAACAVAPEKQTIYSNTPGGLLCGTSSTNQCKVPAGKRLIIEYVSGYAFQPLSANQMTVVTMAITDPALGLNGNGFQVFLRPVHDIDKRCILFRPWDDASSRRHSLLAR